MLDYDVFVPETFPSEDYGIVTPTISFKAENKDGGGFPSADGKNTFIVF